MTSITETNNLGDLLKYEASNLYSRDQITVAKGQNLKLGMVVG
ncbi:MAG: head decoration protein, partial [Wolbachia sp.]